MTEIWLVSLQLDQSRRDSQGLTHTERQMSPAVFHLAAPASGALMNLRWKSFVTLCLAANESDSDNYTCMCMDNYSCRPSVFSLLLSYKYLLVRTQPHWHTQRSPTGWWIVSWQTLISWEWMRQNYNSVGAAIALLLWQRSMSDCWNAGMQEE